MTPTKLSLSVPEPPTHTHGLLSHHSHAQLITDLYAHLDWAHAHLVAYRTAYPDSPVDHALLDIQHHLRMALAWMAFGDLEEEVDHDC